MKFSRQFLGATAFALLAGTGSCVGPRWTSVQQDLELAAMMGLDADSVFNDREGANAVFNVATNNKPQAEWAEVCIWIDWERIGVPYPFKQF